LHAHDDHPVEGGVGLAVPTAVEPVSAVGLAGSSWDGAGAAELGERGVRADAIVVVAGGDEHLRCGVGADAERRDEVGGGGLGELVEVERVGLDHLVELEPPTGQGGEDPAHGNCGVGDVTAGVECGACLDEFEVCQRLEFAAQLIGGRSPASL
jgi:hypothetical protein